MVMEYVEDFTDIFELKQDVSRLLDVIRNDYMKRVISVQIDFETNELIIVFRKPNSELHKFQGTYDTYINAVETQNGKGIQ